MINAKKKMLHLAVIGIAAISFYASVIYGAYYLYYGNANWSWKMSWNFSIPRPQNYNVIADNTDKITGYGGMYVVCEYDGTSFNKVESLSQWEKCDEETADILSEYIDDFQQSFDVQSQENNKFKEYPIVLNKNSMYFSSEDENGDYFIAILDNQDKKVYVIEWTQELDAYTD